MNTFTQFYTTHYLSVSVSVSVSCSVNTPQSLQPRTINTASAFLVLCTPSLLSTKGVMEVLYIVKLPISHTADASVNNLVHMSEEACGSEREWKLILSKIIKLSLSLVMKHKFCLFVNVLFK